jgi:dUTP pyrophosphatase
MNINIKKLTETATIPTRGSEYAAGYDLYADIEKDVFINPSLNATIGSGIAAEIPNGYFGAIFARSGIAKEKELRPANCVGVIDSDYRGEIKIVLHNDSPYLQKVSPQERIAQLVILPYMNVDFNIVDELEETVRGEGGFGSTGTN